MSKTKNTPGIHLYKTELTIMDVARGIKPVYYWVIITKNGNIIGRSWRTYTRKGNAIKSIKAAAKVFNNHPGWQLYYDHSKPNSPLKSYL